MSEFPFNDIDREYSEAQSRLDQAIRSEKVIELAAGNGPLSLSVLPREFIMDRQIQDIMARDGWPDRSDQLIEGVERFATSEDFIDSLRPVDAYGSKYLGSSRFMHMIAYPPIRQYIDASSEESITGLYPVVHRAHAVAPELFESLQIITNKQFERFRMVHDNDHLYDEIMQPQNQPQRDAMYVAYQIMGRLIKVDDNQWMNRVFDSDKRDRPPILNADTYLRRGE